MTVHSSQSRTYDDVLHDVVIGKLTRLEPSPAYVSQIRASVSQALGRGMEQALDEQEPVGVGCILETSGRRRQIRLAHDAGFEVEFCFKNDA